MIFIYIDPIQSRIDSNELNRHGVLGMKWGVRKQSEYTPHRLKSEIPKRTEEINKLLNEAKVGGYKIDNIKRQITISRYPEFYTYDIDSFKISKKK